MSLESMTINELQNLAKSGVAEAYSELGKKVVDYNFCFDDNRHCEHRLELMRLENDLNSEIPPECPHCGKWITEI